MQIPSVVTHTHESTVKLGYSNIGFCDTLSIALNIQWYALIPHKAYSFITTLFLGPFDDVITKFYCIFLISCPVCIIVVTFDVQSWQDVMCPLS
jgi:hypothetical protein